MDRAQAREEEMRADALADHLRRSVRPAQESAHECAMCGLSIPEGRRAAMPGVQTCVECQADIERFGEGF